MSRAPDQPQLEGMPSRLYPATPARLSTYADCPRRYRLAYLDRPSPPRAPTSAQTSVGAAVHTALARWWGLPQSRRTPESGGRLLVEAWLTDGFRDPPQSDAARDRSRQHVEGYLADVDPSAEPVAVERTVTVRTTGASLWGRVDRVDDRPGGLVVVDYKTGRRPSIRDARSSLALAVYAAGTARLLRRPCARVELHHVPTGEVVGWEHTEKALADHLGAADALAVELASLDARHRAGLSESEADETFPARVASRCGWCEVQAGCRPGRTVPRRLPWDGVDESAGG